MDCTYENFPLLSIDQFPLLLDSRPQLAGLNITIPYKELIIPYLHELDEKAKEIGAVNTVTVVAGKLKGFNTDVFGFMQSILPLIQPHQTQALILGTGGSSKAVAYGLKTMGLSYQLVSRNPEQPEELYYSNIDKDMLRQYKIIINTTPVGMFPNIDDCPPILYEYLTPSHLLFDLIYNPPLTAFLQKGKEKGASIKNGLQMLQLQAEKSWEIWNSNPSD